MSFLGTNDRERAPILDHSIRSFLYARLLAEHEGSLGDAAYDQDLLFAACTLHDLGLGTGAAGEARFEVEGADLAAVLLSEHGVAARRHRPRLGGHRPALLLRDR